MSKTKLLSSFCTASNLIFHDLVENQPKNCELAKIPASFLVIEAEDFKDAVRRRETHWLAGVGERLLRLLRLSLIHRTIQSKLMRTSSKDLVQSKWEGIVKGRRREFKSFSQGSVLRVGCLNWYS
jgi:hypothetical protein